jgi:hypothetical protein
VGHYADEYAAREARERTIAVRVGDWRELNAEVARLRDADAVLTRWGKLRAEYAALRGRQDHAPTHEESVAAWARMDELEAEIELAFLAVRLASDARGMPPG